MSSILQCVGTENRNGTTQNKAKRVKGKNTMSTRRTSIPVVVVHVSIARSRGTKRATHVKKRAGGSAFAPLYIAFLCHHLVIEKFTDGIQYLNKTSPCGRGKIKLKLATRLHVFYTWHASVQPICIRRPALRNCRVVQVLLW